MESTDWKLKLKAILHDPPYKIKMIKDHEIEGERLFKKIMGENVEVDKEKIKNADQIASAQSRIIVSPSNLLDLKAFEELSRVSFEECKFLDIFMENKEDIQTPDQEKVERIIEKLGKLPVFKDKDEKAKFAFLFLWRFYPEIFPEINKHPADSRAPNHSIYDHLVETSAIASALPSPAFLLFTIAPVQSFISKARKTSDLWAGSYMLSYLIWKSMKPIVEKYGPDIIVYPNLLRQPIVDIYLRNINFGDQSLNFGNKTFEDILKSHFDSEKLFENFINNFSYDKLTIANLPNRFLAIIPYNAQLGNVCEEAFKTTLKELAERVLKSNLNKQNINSYDEKKIVKQIEQQLLSYFQVYWAVVPWIQNAGLDDVLNDYAQICGKDELYTTVDEIIKYMYYKTANIGSAYSLLFELTEKLLSARKSIRDFKQVEQTGEKCHICGEFEVLDIDWEKLTPKIVKEGERLCGICLTKRLFPEIIKDEFGLPDAVKFPSTSEMASVGEKRKLDFNIKSQFKQEFNNFEKKVEGLSVSISVPKLKGDFLYKIDGQYLMEETYRTNYFKKEYEATINKEDYQDILKFLREHKINPSRYYAILQMDGDDIGKWLKGEFNPKIENTIHEKTRDALIQFSDGENRKNLQKILSAKHPNSPSIHQAFSRRLSHYALEEVRKIVEEEHYGKLIYAGGDDVLAFLPVEDVLKCAYDLQYSFKRTLSPKASMSAGILIVHHKFPLYLALKKVNEAEKTAKNKYGKNGFCLVFLTHSGEERECGGKWDFVEFIEDLIIKFKTDEISGIFPFQYLEVVEQLYNKENNKNILEIKEILKSELRRIFMKKQGNNEKLKHYLEEKILPYFEELDIENLANLLVIAKKISTEVKK